MDTEVIMGRILVIAPQFVGDSVLAIPFLRELKKHCGRKEIDVISKNAGILIFSRCQYVNEVYNIKELDFAKLRKNDYEKAYILKRSLSAAIIAFLSGAKERIGFGGQFREPFLTKIVKYDKWAKHEMEHFFDVLREDYVEITSEKLEFSVDKTAQNGISGYLSDKKKALVVACSSTYVKDWDLEKFAKVIDWLSEKDYEAYFVGLDKERIVYDAISELTNGAITKNLCGKLNWDETVALISEMDLVFGVDTGFCHIGAALGKKVVTLFGATSVVQWKPLGDSVVVSADLECAPCNKPKKCTKSYVCMKDISTEVVISEIEKLL